MLRKLWELTAQVFEAFEMEDGTQDSIFQNCDQLIPEGFEKLFGCYSDGMIRLDKIFRQEILFLLLNKNSLLKRSNFTIHQKRKRKFWKLYLHLMQRHLMQLLI